MASTGICNSFKLEILQGGHNLNANLTLGVTNSSGNATLTAISSTAGITVGMGITGTNVAAGAIVKSVDSASQVTMSAVSTGIVSSATFAGDTFKLALVKVSPSTTFSATMTNIGTPGSSASSTSNLGTDEVAASGTYSSGGATLVNTTPVLSGTTACGTWSNVTFTGATLSVTAAIIYNSSARQGAAATPLSGRTVEVLDFGGTNTVTSGSLTLTFPAQSAGNAVLQIA